MPSCSCPDWQKSHWPCKHMLSLFLLFPENGWDSLSKSYTASPYFNLDKNVTEPTSKETDPTSEYNTNEDTSMKTPLTPVKNQTKEAPVRRDCLRECFDTLKTIRLGLYVLTSVGVLKEVKERLWKIDALIENHKDKVEGLPIHSNLPKRRKSKRSKQGEHSITKRERSNKNGNVEIDGLYS